MTSVVIAYASREGQTRRIAERMATRLRARGFAVDLVDVVRGIPPQFDLARYDAAIVAASIHIGRHARRMLAFVRRHRAELERKPTLFLSVSLSAAGAVDANATAKRRASAAANRDGMIARFLRETGWQPGVVHPVAGALLYRQYGVLVRAMMRLISGMVGASTDTSRDHDYTDWDAVDGYADEVAALVK
jgi:menaquinone-dependent protoporphyrinogen oxidase